MLIVKMNQNDATDFFSKEITQFRTKQDSTEQHKNETKANCLKKLTKKSTLRKNPTLKLKSLLALTSGFFLNGSFRIEVVNSS